MNERPVETYHHPVLAQTPVVVCIPSVDRAFQVAVQAALDTIPERSADALEARLRSLYPRAIVRPRALSGDSGTLWYAYRDGAFAPVADPVWHTEPGVAWMRLSATGLIVATNEALARLLGAPGQDLAGHDVWEFVIPENAEMNRRQLEAILRGETLHSIARARGLDGQDVLVEYVAQLIDGDVHAWYRHAALATPSD